MAENEPKKQGGRPPKDPDEKRSELLKTYVRPPEAEQIKFRCQMGGLSISDFLRELALNNEISTEANPEELRAIRAELGKIGSNINQIAKAVNTDGKFRAERFEKLSEQLLNTLEEL